MSARVLTAMALTSRLNGLPFEDEAGKAEIFEQILGRPLPLRVTIYPPFYTDHGLHLDLAERRNGYRLCQWDVRDPNVIAGVPLPPVRPASAPPRTANR